MKQICILVLGMHRSGTSALTGVLQYLNVDLGSELLEGSQENEKGFFENLHLMLFNDKILNKTNSSWDDVFFDYDIQQNLITKDDTAELKSILLREFSSSKLFAIKDPRICYLFPLYEQVLKELQIDIKVLLPYRNPVEVAQSLEKRNGFSIEKSIALWFNHFLEAELGSRTYPRYFLKFDTLLSETEQVIKQIDRFLDTNLYEKYINNKTEIDSFLEPSLKHNNLEDLALKKGIRFILEDFLNIYNEDLNSVSKETFDAMQYKNSEIRVFYSHLNKELEHTKKELSNTKEELSDTKEELSNTKEELSNTKEELNGVYTSKSWKLTTPLTQIIP